MVTTMVRQEVVRKNMAAKAVDHCTVAPPSQRGRDRLRVSALDIMESRPQDAARGRDIRDCDGNPRAHRIGIVDPAPKMTAIRHVAGLATAALLSIGACLPLLEGVLNGLAVEGILVGLELVARGTESGALEGGSAVPCTVGEAFGPGFRGGAVPPRRPVPPILPHVTGRTDQALGAQTW